MNTEIMKPCDDPRFARLTAGPLNSPIKCDTYLFRLNASVRQNGKTILGLSRNSANMVFNHGSLSEVIEKLKIKPADDGLINLILWVYTPVNGLFVFAANDIGIEGEWYLLGGYDETEGAERCLAKGSDRDLTGFLAK